MWLVRNLRPFKPRLAALHLNAVMADVQQDAHRGHRDEQRGAAVTDERQRDADDGEGAADHEEVAGRLPNDKQHDAERQDLAIDVARARRCNSSRRPA